MGEGQRAGTGRTWAGGVLVATAGVLFVVVGVLVWLVIRSPAPAGAGTGSARGAMALEAVLDAGERYLREGDAGKAAAVLSEGVRDYSQSQALRLSYAKVLVSLRRFAEAYEQYEKALAIGPREPGIEFAAGGVASEAGLRERALEHYAAAVAGEPGNARYAMFLGQAQMQAGDLPAATGSLLRATRLEPDLAIAWGTLAEVALRQNRSELAIQHIARARALEPNLLAWRIIEARARKRLGDPRGALMLLDGLDPPELYEPPVRRIMVEAYGMLGRTADAARYLGSAADADRTDGQLAYEAAVWARRAGDEGGSRELARRAVTLGNERARSLLEEKPGG